MKRAAWLLFLCLAACAGTSPEPDFYDLAAVNGTPHANASLSIKIQRPSIPGYLDRPDIVRQENAYQYKIDEFHRWSEPLDRMFERILAADLRQRLPGSKILGESDTGTNDLRYVVDTSIDQFNAIGPDTASLKATLAITDKTGRRKFAPQPIGLTASGGASPDAIAAGLSQLIGLYADRIQSTVGIDYQQ